MFFSGSSGVASRAVEPQRIEAFDQSFAGGVTMLLGNPGCWLSHLAAIESEQLYRGRSILVLQEGAGARGVGAVPSLLWRRRWDCVFRVKEGFEAQMLATYVANAPRPIRIAWFCLPMPSGAPSCEIPRALSSRWTGVRDVTLLGCGTTAPIGGVEWDSIVFPSACGFSMLEQVLQGRGGVSRIKDGFDEIRASGAAIVWSNRSERGTVVKKEGGLYWTEGVEESDIAWSKEEISETLRSIASSLA